MLCVCVCVGGGGGGGPYPLPRRKSTMCRDVRSSSSMARWRAVNPPGYPGRGAPRSTPSAYTWEREEGRKGEEKREGGGGGREVRCDLSLSTNSPPTSSPGEVA